MSLLASQLKFLSILAENSRQPSPKVVDSSSIANMLNMDVKEMKQMINSMNDMGVIQSDMEGKLSLITQKGISWLERCSSH